MCVCQPIVRNRKEWESATYTCILIMQEISSETISNIQYQYVWIC